MAADVVLPNPDLACRPVDIAPSKREQLALAKASHCGDEIQRPVGRAEGVIVGGSASQQGFELVVVEKVDIGVVSEPR